MESILMSSGEQLDILIIALYGYMNHTKSRLEKVDNPVQKKLLLEKIKTIENIINQLES